jgi:hypothetical protein
MPGGAEPSARAEPWPLGDPSDPRLASFDPVLWDASPPEAIPFDATPFDALEPDPGSVSDPGDSDPLESDPLGSDPLGVSPSARPAGVPATSLFGRIGF